jgi:penicillin-binding protein-related factor A (putative recombinase)
MNNFGKALELSLEYLHNLYRADGLADIYHERTAGKFVGNGKFVPDPEKSRPDFTGVISPVGTRNYPGGRFIAFDAKSVSGKELRWRLKKDRAHQFEALASLDHFGAIAFFLIENRIRKTLFLLRIRFDDLGSIEVPTIAFDAPYAESELLKIPIESGGLPDYLPEILRSITFEANLNRI